MAEFINFESEEEEGEDSEYDTDTDNESYDDNDDIDDFIDDKVIPYQEYVHPPNPYLGLSLQLPRGLDSVVRVSYLIFICYIFRREKGHLMMSYLQ